MTILKQRMTINLNQGFTGSGETYVLAYAPQVDYSGLIV